jgi:hypothetical protein
MMAKRNKSAEGIYQPSNAELTGGAQTADYVVSQYSPQIQLYANRPWFSLWQAEAMLWDQQVWFGLQLGTAPLLSAECEVRHPDPDVKKWVQQQWDNLWGLHGTKIAATRYFGYAGFEVEFREVKGLVEICGLRDFHPNDVRPLLAAGQKNGGRVAGVAVHGQRSSEVFSSTHSPIRPTYLFGMSGLWLNHRARFSSNYGRAGTEPAYPAWWDKAMPGGAYDMRRLRAIKDAWVGDVIKYPTTKKFVMPDGTVVSAKAIAQEIVENRASGAVVLLPSDADEKGRPFWEYQPPQTVAPSDVIDKWLEAADWDIFDGVLVPKEVVEAATSGSGFSGRSIPMVMFLGLRDGEFTQYVQALKLQIFQPLVARNWGLAAAEELEMVPVPLIDTMSDQVGGQQMGGAVGGSTPDAAQQGPQAPAGASGVQPGAGGSERGPVQWSVDQDETKGRWITLEDTGTHIKIDGDGNVLAGPRALEGKHMSGGPARGKGEAAEDDIAEGADDFDFGGGPDMPKKKKPKAPKLPKKKALNPDKNALHSAVVSQADRYGLDPHDLLDAVDVVHEAMAQPYHDMQKLKAEIRMQLGYNAATFSRLENSHKDLSNLPGFDDAARQIASDHPELGFGGEGTGLSQSNRDYARDLYDFLREGGPEKRLNGHRIYNITKDDPKVLKAAVQMVQNAKTVSEWESSMPFALQFSTEQMLGLIGRGPQAQQFSADNDRYATALTRQIQKRVVSLLKKNGSALSRASI